MWIHEFNGVCKLLLLINFRLISESLLIKILNF